MRNAIAMLAIATAGLPAAQAAPPLRFACTATGAKLLMPAADAAAVCERMRVALARASGLVLRTDPGPPALRVTLRFTKNGVASARLETARNGTMVAHPEVNIAVSDRAPGMDTVDALARSVATMVDGRRRGS